MIKFNKRGFTVNRCFLIYSYCAVLSSFTSFTALAAADEDNQPALQKVAKPANIVINSQVKGSQEQPKVLYIMPWQGIKKPMAIDDSNKVIIMPKFAPINPKAFKRQVNSYYQNKSK